MKAEAIFLNNIGSVIWFTGNANHILTINSNFKKKKSLCKHSPHLSQKQQTKQKQTKKNRDYYYCTNSSECSFFMRLPIIRNYIFLNMHEIQG